jgi:cyclophilin family peptidyl-prolyl cis-trans isomerase
MNLKRENLRSEAQTRLHKMSQMINEIYRNEGKKQDLVMKFIEALNVAKRDLEEDLLSNNFNELDEINDEIAHARRILNGTNVQGLNGLIGNLSYKQKQLEQILFKTVAFPLQNICHSTPTDVLKLIHSYACAKLGPSLIGNCQQNVLPPAMKKSLGTLINTNGVIHHQSIGPRYYFDMEMNGIAMGRIIIETRPDVAPKMCENFRCLASSEKGYGYKGCVVFQCWKGESVILGDFEHQNGRGGHSIYEDEPLFMPEDTRLAAMRGAIGMRRTQKRHDSKGLVGSQFRIILQEMPGFTGIFGRVLEGIEIVDKISECGDPSGNPTKRIVIKSCGILSSA